MKSKSAIFAALVLSMNGALANKGGNGSHGGDAVAGAFYSVGQRIVSALDRECRAGFGTDERGVCAEALPALRKLVAEVEVKSRDRVYADDGKERDAVNDGAAKIRAGRARWRAADGSRFTPGNRVRIVAHEYLIIARLEKSDRYWVSENVLAFLSRRNQDIFAIAGIDRGAKPGIGEIVGALLQSPELEKFIGTTLVPPNFHFGDGGYRFQAIRILGEEGGLERTFADRPEAIGLRKVDPKSEISYSVTRFELEYKQPFTGQIVKIHANLIRNPFRSQIDLSLAQR